MNEIELPNCPMCGSESKLFFEDVLECETCGLIGTLIEDRIFV